MGSTIRGALGGAAKLSGTLFGGLFGVVLPGFGDFIESGFGSVADFIDPPPPTSKYRVLKNDIKFSQTSEGDVLPLIMGQLCKVPGALVWVGDVKKKVVTPGGGKGGAGDTEGGTLKTFADLLYLMSENPLAAGGSVVEIRAGGVTIYREDGVLTYADLTDITATAGTFSGGLPKLTLTSPKDGTAISNFYAGKDIVLSNFDNAANDGTWRVTSAKYYKKTGTSTLILKDPTGTKQPVSETPATSCTLAQTLPDVKKFMDSGTVLPGGPSQVMPLDYTDVEEFSPGYRLRSGFIFVKLNILRVTSLFNLEFYIDERSAALQLSEAVDLILTYRSDLETSQWDSSRLVGIVKSLVVNESNAFDALEPLTIAYNFSYRDEGGVVVFFHNDGSYTDNVDITDSHTGTAESTASSSESPKVLLSLGTTLTDPRSSVVSFTDVNNEQQKGTATQVRFGTVTDAEITTDLLGLGLAPSGARVIAKRLLYDVPYKHLEATLTLPPLYLGIMRHDVVNVKIDADIYPMLVVGVEEQNDYLVTVSARSHSQGLPYTAPAIVTQGTKDPFTTELDVAGFKTAALVYDHLDKPGWYLAAGRTDDSTDWTGATLYKRIDTDDTPTYDWLAVMDVMDEAVVGKFVAEDSTYHGSWISNTSAEPLVSTWDTETELVVQLHSEEITLESRTDYEVLSGANRAMWGEELIAFATVAYLGDATWRLSRLLRGLRDTLNQGSDEELSTIRNYSFGFLSDADRVAGHLPPSGATLTNLKLEKTGNLSCQLTLMGAGNLGTVDGGFWREHKLIKLAGFTNPDNNGLFRISIDVDSIPGGLVYGLVDFPNLVITETSATATASLAPNTDKFVLISSDGIHFKEETLTDIGKENHYKLVPDNAELDDVEEFIVDLRPTTVHYNEYSAANRRGTLAPFGPSNVKVSELGLVGWTEGAGAAQEDIVIEVERRTRAINQALLTPILVSPYPLLEELESYEIKIYYTKVGDTDINSSGQQFTLMSTPALTPQAANLSQPVVNVLSVIYTGGTWFDVTASLGSWTAAGFVAGDTVILDGFMDANTNGQWIVQSVGPTILVIYNPASIPISNDFSPLSTSNVRRIIPTPATHLVTFPKQIIKDFVLAFGGLGPKMRLEIWQLSGSVGRGTLSAFDVQSDGTVTTG